MNSKKQQAMEQFLLMLEPFRVGEYFYLPYKPEIQQMVKLQLDFIGKLK